MPNDFKSICWALLAYDMLVDIYVSFWTVYYFILDFLCIGSFSLLFFSSLVIIHVDFPNCNCILSVFIYFNNRVWTKKFILFTDKLKITILTSSNVFSKVLKKLNGMILWEHRMRPKRYSYCHTIYCNRNTWTGSNNGPVGIELFSRITYYTQF